MQGSASVNVFSIDIGMASDKEIRYFEITWNMKQFESVKWPNNRHFLVKSNEFIIVLYRQFTLFHE